MPQANRTLLLIVRLHPSRTGSGLAVSFQARSSTSTHTNRANAMHCHSKRAPAPQDSSQPQSCPRTSLILAFPPCLGLPETGPGQWEATHPQTGYWGQPCVQKALETLIRAPLVAVASSWSGADRHPHGTEVVVPVPPAVWVWPEQSARVSLQLLTQPALPQAPG